MRLSTKSNDWEQVVRLRRPLGLVFDHQTNSIVTCDAYVGLVRVSLSDGEITVLSTEADGVPFKFANNLAIAQDGSIYFTDSSDKWTWDEGLLWIQIYFFLHHHFTKLFSDFFDQLEGVPHGRLLKYSPFSKKTTVLVKDLKFPNGVALSEKEDFILLTVTNEFRIARYW